TCFQTWSNAMPIETGDFTKGVHITASLYSLTRPAYDNISIIYGLAKGGIAVTTFTMGFDFKPQFLSSSYIYRNTTKNDWWPTSPSVYARNSLTLPYVPLGDLPVAWVNQVSPTSELWVAGLNDHAFSLPQAPTVDGVATNTLCGNGTATCTTTITTTHSNDVLIVWAYETLDQVSTPCTFTVSSAGLTWNA